MNNCSILLCICGITLITIGVCSSFLPKNLWDDTNIMTICNIVVAIGVIGTLIYSQISLNHQRTQWLNDAFIKHEADVLLEFRVAYGDAQEAIHFFLDNLLNPIHKMDIQIKEIPLIRREKIVKYYNSINTLNILYNKNQYIFRKHNLEKSISSLTCFLDVVYLLPEKDLEFNLIGQDEKIKAYQLAEWNKIVQTFTMSAYVLFNNEIPQMQNIDVEFDKSKKLVSEGLLSLTYKLDELTLYNDKTNISNLNVRQSKYYSSLSK